MAKSNTGARLIVSLFVLSFALMFVGGGVVSGAMLYLQMRDSWSARSYVPVPAQVGSVVLDQSFINHKDRRYRTEAEFSYTFEGRPYVSSRVSLNRAADELVTYQKNMYDRLLAAQENHRPVELWVDPDNPENSVHDRSIRWERSLTYLVVGSLFLFMGIKVLVFLYHGLKKR